MIKKLLLLSGLLVAQCYAQAAPVAANTGKAATFTATVSSGTPPFVWTFNKDGKTWTPPVAPTISTDGMMCVFTISNLQITDSGTYLVNVYNSAGNTNSPATVLSVTQLIVLPGGAVLSITIK